MSQGRVPSYWDDDWGISADKPSNSSNDAYTPVSDSAAPPAIILSQSQPRTLYKPELKILKRANNNSSSTVNRSSTPPAPSTSPSVEAQRKERERRYQEAKDRIFAESPTAATNDGSYSGVKQPQQQKKKQGKTGGRVCDKASRINSSNSSRGSSPPQTAAAEKPLKQPPTLIGTGTIKSFSLNSATIITGPIKAREREEWQLRQVAIDGKMLESQAEACGYGGVNKDELLGDKEKGLDWDEFRRDKWSGDGNVVGTDSVKLQGRLERLEVADKASNDQRRKNGEINQNNAVQSTVVRMPRGPDANSGKGFNGRGRGGAGRRGGLGS